jgi:UDP-N-acetyl-D-galactosamine dehydrogenase
MKKKFRLAIVGLGYVGLPLAVEFGKYFETYGYDISTNRIKSLKKFKDPNKEITFKEFSESKNLQFYYNPKILSKADIIIVAVPTPIKKNLKPD